jgi:TIR domain/Cyclic nucleotide-binding domain
MPDIPASMVTGSRANWRVTVIKAGLYSPVREPGLSGLIYADTVTGQDAPEVPGHAFISYVREDASRVKRLVRILEAAGIKVWQDTADILPGQDWKNAIKDAIKTGSLAFIACFSENSQQRQKTFQNEELILAAEEMRQHQYGVTWLIPVRFADCDMPPIDLGNNRTLRSLHRVDLFGRNWELGAVRLTTAVRNILGAPAATRSEPPARDPGQAEEEGTDAAAVPFWDFLYPTERERLRAMASPGTFAKGAVIMRQGESASHVIVILGGMASICVNENGTKRELAKRSEGQLIGESAALQVGTRSATVIALEKITALVVQTREFATFLSEGHPRILQFVQDQRDARGTNETDEYGYGDTADPRAAPADGTATSQPNNAPARDQRPLTGENCTVIFTDVVAFGAHKRTNTDRMIIRNALHGIIQAAIQGFPGARFETRGDGDLIVIPPDVSTARAMDQMLRVVPRALDQHNSSHPDSAQFQLRLSVDVGPVTSDGMGVDGEAIIVAARMVEALAFKRALAKSPACLGIIVSPFVYDTVVKHDQDRNYVASYSQVIVRVKEYRTAAWITLIE